MWPNIGRTSDVMGKVSTAVVPETLTRARHSHPVCSHPAIKARPFRRDVSLVLLIYISMASSPHGGVLKVRSFTYSWCFHLDTILSKDLLARDQDIHHQLKEESLTLDDISLSDVCTLFPLATIVYQLYASVSFATSS